MKKEQNKTPWTALLILCAAVAVLCVGALIWLTLGGGDRAADRGGRKAA
jgi:hypothetical protein